MANFTINSLSKGSITNEKALIMSDTNGVLTKTTIGDLSSEIHNPSALMGWSGDVYTALTTGTYPLGTTGTLKIMDGTFYNPSEGMCLIFMSAWMSGDAKSVLELQIDGEYVRDISGFPGQNAMQISDTYLKNISQGDHTWELFLKVSENSSGNKANYHYKAGTNHVTVYKL